jgi:hypothetical protein
MPYVDTNSITAADVNNCLRGFYRDNTTHTVTGTTDETTMGTVSVTAGTITATGALHVVAAGTATNVGGTAKTVKLYLGATAVATVSRTGANAQDWLVDAWCFNTAAAAQRWVIVYSTTDATTVTMDYTTSAIDTASAATLKCTATLTGATETVTQTAFDVFVVQVT